MKASTILLPALLLLGVSTAATAQTQPANTSTVGGGTTGTQMQTGTTTQPSTMPSGASIGNNRDVLSPGTGTTPTGTVSPASGSTSGQSSMSGGSGQSGDKRAMRKAKGKKMKTKSATKSAM